MMFLVVLLYSLLLSATGQQDKNDWVDPFDMLNYDAGSKTMRKPAQPTEYNNVPTKRREYTQDSGMAALDLCRKQVVDLQRQIEEQKKQIALILQQPTCSPVFKRFLNRLLNEIQRVGVPSDSSDAFYDAKISLSRQGMTEIQALLDGDDNCRTGALDNAISQILVDLRPQDYEAWKWRFEDTFGVEIDTLLKMGMFVLAIVAIICTELWSAVSWFVQFKRVFAVSFFISIIWNWFYLYKIAFAEHQNNIMKMDKEVEKCTGVKKIDWSDSLKEWFRSTWTLQDDPCKKYYEAIMVNPILLVPPTKALSVTITTFITEPLKHVGKGISDFLIALLKDLPITLQVPVLLIIVIAIVVCMYGSVQAAFQYGITAPLRHRRDPPPPELEQPQPQLQRVDYLARGDALKQAPRHQADNGRLHGNQVPQRRANRLREEPAPVVVETLRTADPAYSEDEIDADRREVEQNPSAESDSENQQEILEEPAGASAGRVEANVAQAQNKPSKLNLNQSEAEPVTVNANCSQGESSRDDAALRPQATGRQPSQTDVQDLEALAGDEASSISVGLSVQETLPAE